MRLWFDFLQKRKNRWPRSVLVGVALAFLAVRLCSVAHFYTHSAQLDNLAATGKHELTQSACELCIAAQKANESGSAPISPNHFRSPCYQGYAEPVAAGFSSGVAQHYAIRGPPSFDT